MKLYVGNLAYSTTEETLQSEFGAYGAVAGVEVVMDRETGRPRGFAFVTMPDEAEARRAIEHLHSTQLDDRTITVNEARPKPDREKGLNRDQGERPSSIS